TPDSTFGSNGQANAGITVADLTTHLDDKIIAAGLDIVIVGPEPEGGNIGRQVFAVARFNGDGTADSTFGDGGKVLTQLSDVSSDARAVIVQPNGQIIAVGAANNKFGLARYD